MTEDSHEFANYATATFKGSLIVKQAMNNFPKFAELDSAVQKRIVAEGHHYIRTLYAAYAGDDHQFVSNVLRLDAVKHHEDNLRTLLTENGIVDDALGARNAMAYINSEFHLCAASPERYEQRARKESKSRASEPSPG